MVDNDGQKDKPSAFAIACRWWLAIFITVLLILGLLFVYIGLGVGKRKCLKKYLYEPEYYHWNCRSYYAGDFAFIALETVLVSFVPLAVYLKLRKPLRFPLMGFLIIITVFLIMSLGKFANEQPERGLFLKPDDGSYGSPYVGRNYDLSITKEKPYSRYARIGSYDHVCDNGSYTWRKEGKNEEGSYYIKGVKSFEVMELKSVHTHNGPRMVAVMGYCLTVAGNLMLMLYIGIDDVPSISLPKASKYKKTMDRLRSNLAALIAPSSKPLSEDEDEEQNTLVEKEMTSV